MHLSPILVTCTLVARTLRGVIPFYDPLLPLGHELNGLDSEWARLDKRGILMLRSSEVKIDPFFAPKEESCRGRSRGGSIYPPPFSALSILRQNPSISTYYTVLVLRTAHRKWKETKQQQSMLPGSAVPGSCFVSFHILWPS